MLELYQALKQAMAPYLEHYTDIVDEWSIPTDEQIREVWDILSIVPMDTNSLIHLYDAIHNDSVETLHIDKIYHRAGLRVESSWSGYPYFILIPPKDLSIEFSQVYRIDDPRLHCDAQIIPLYSNCAVCGSRKRLYSLHQVKVQDLRDHIFSFNRRVYSDEDPNLVILCCRHCAHHYVAQITAVDGLLVDDIPQVTVSYCPTNREYYRSCYMYHCYSGEEDAYILERTSESMCPLCTYNATRRCSVCDINYAHTRQTDTGSEVCINCEPAWYGRCFVCDRSILRDNPGEDNHCSMCASSEDGEYEEPCEAIRSYSYKPQPLFYIARGKKKEIAVTTQNEPPKATRVYGIELEVEYEGNSSANHHEMADYIQRYPGWYCKWDGSLDNGFEIVSHPRTLQAWLSTDLNWMDKLIKGGYRSYNTSTCGLHIHASTHTLQPTHEAKVMEFFSKNDRFIRKVSRRKGGTLGRWAHIEKADLGTFCRWSRHKTSNERYVAINRTHFGTLEFRIFRGTLHAPSFTKCLLFTDSILQFAIDSSFNDLSRSMYLDYLSKSRWNRKLYLELGTWLKSVVGPENVEETNSEQEED